MELKQVIRIFWRWWWLLIVGAGLASVTALIISRLTTPIYEASATFLITEAPTNGTTLDYDSLLAGERLATTYAELLRRRPVLQTVIATLKLNTTSDALAKKIHVSVVPDTQLIELTVEDSNPQRAADIANEIVQVFDQQNREVQTAGYGASKQNLQQEMDKVQASLNRAEANLIALGTPTTPQQRIEQHQLQETVAQYRASYTSLLQSFEQVRLAETQTTDSVTIIEAAQPAALPARPRTLLNIVLASIIGTMLALGVIFFKEYFDESISSSDEVEHLLGVPALVSIARMKRSGSLDPLSMSAQPPSAIIEAYRTLQASIDFSAIDTPIRRIVVTSSEPLEGKSTTVANLAIAAAHAGKRVILVDTDLRRPALHRFFDQPNHRGVTTALLDKRGVPSDHLFSTQIANLWLMPSGPLPPNAAELIGSQRMGELIESLATQADLVLFDSPPALPVIDAVVLSRACDATVLVVRTGATKADTLRRVKERFAQSRVRMLGVVLTFVPLSRADYQTYSYFEGAYPRSKTFIHTFQHLYVPHLLIHKNKSTRSSDTVKATDMSVATTKRPIGVSPPSEVN